MQKKQIVSLSMTNRVKNLLNGIDVAILGTIPMVLLWFTNLKTRLAALELQIAAFDEIIKGFEKTKRIAREALTLAALDLALQLQAYANSIDDTTLFDNMAFTRSMFDKCNSTDLIAFTLNILNTATANVASLADFGVTPASLAIFATTRTTYETALEKPEEAKLAKQAANLAINVGLREIMALWVKIDRAIKGARLAHPILEQNYFRARKLIHLPTRTYAVVGLVTNAAGIAMPFVTLTCATLNLNRKTTKKGRFIIKTGAHMEHVLIFNYPGYQETKVIVTITSGLCASIEVVMQLNAIAQ